MLGLSGPGTKISGIMPCTVIRPGDMADAILDRDRHPEWNGQRTKLVYSFPTDEALWKRYAEVRAESLRQGNGGEEATAFYRDHRAAIDEGAVVAWPERFNHDELSAVQHAMNLRLQDEAAFFAEYQNEPLPAETASDDELTVEQIAGKLNRMKRGEVPVGVNHVTAFIDVQGNLLFWVVAGWEDDFTGYVLDYGAYPDQKRPSECSAMPLTLFCCDTSPGSSRWACPEARAGGRSLRGGQETVTRPQPGVVAHSPRHRRTAERGEPGS